MNLKDIKISVISENEGILKKIKRSFPGDGIHLHWESDLQNILQNFEDYLSDVLVLSAAAYRKDDYKGLLKNINSVSPLTQIILLVEPENVEEAISTLKSGTFQYAKLPVSDVELRLLIESAIEKRPQFGEKIPEKTSIQKDRFGPLVGRSLPMRQVYQQIKQAAATDIPILLLGETGSGKDLVAQTIHRHSDRHGNSYVPVNLGALPAQLVASELFGHEKGAFTGSVSRHKGVFEQGSEGTVFLDEIDTIDEKVQVSLLRLIEQKKFHRLGGKTAINTNARIIAASNENLEALVDRGIFRKDLYYRLDVFRISIPPLRERLDDISILVQEMIARYNRQFNKSIRQISPECIEVLNVYEWPGNVRELKNVIQRAVLVCEGNEILTKHLPPRFRPHQERRPAITFEVGTPLDQVEKEMVLKALSIANNNRKKAAQLLGISRRAIYNKLRKHDIK